MRLTLLLASLALLTNAAAQLTVSGRVLDTRGLPLPGVNVYVPSTYEGATTDSLGAFSFSASAKTPFTVLTQFIGYRVDSALVTKDNVQLTLKLRESATALAEVVVSAGAFVASDTRKTAVLSSVDVATTGSTADLAEALSTLPGSTPAGESGQLLVRGGAANETQAYINGMRVPKLYTSGLPDVPTRTRFSPFAFKGITFATGGFSAAYGDALSGALILQTADAPDQNLTQVSLMSIGGDITRTQLLPNNHALAIGVGGTHLGLYAQLNEEARSTLTTAPQGLNAQAAHWWTGSTGNNIKTFVQASTQHFERTNPAESQFYGATTLGLDNYFVYGQSVYQEQRGTTGLWEFGLSGGANRDRLNIDGQQIATDQLDVLARATYSDNFRDLALWRVGVEHGQRRERVEVMAQQEFEGVATQSSFYQAAFAEADWFLASKWVVRTGLRGDSYNYNDANMHLSPRVQLSHLFSADQQLAASAGRYVQRQAADSLFARDHNLRAAGLDYYGLTYSSTINQRVLRVEAYAKQYHHLASLTPSTGEWATLGDGYARGLDVFYRDRKSVREADFWISYSFIDTKRKRNGLQERVPVPFAARHNLAIVAKRYFPKPSIGLSATYRFHSGRPFDNPNSDERFGGVTPQFHDLSANVTYLTNIAGHFTVVFASLSNVAGLRQVHQYRYAQQPNVDGHYERLAVDSLFPSFPFVGMFVMIGEKDRTGSVDDI